MVLNNVNDTRELGQFIPLHYHFVLLSDKDRMAGFRAAIDHVVKPGATVLELGGGTGVLSFFAAQKARKVFCVELNLDLVDASRRILQQNRYGDRVEVIHADASDYVPPEPVDVVICEMLHVGLCREKQLAVLDAFKSRYQNRFDGTLPMFVPEAVLQAVQPIQYDFQFEGYYAPFTLLSDPYCADSRTTPLGDPVVYHQLLYEEPFGLACQWSGTMPITAEGTLNALRVITKNILAIVPETSSAIDWHSNYLVQPLEREISVRPGQTMTIALDYLAGAPMSEIRPVVTGPL
jgi:SAM-dependent methyltransferase